MKKYIIKEMIYLKKNCTFTALFMIRWIKGGICKTALFQYTKSAMLNRIKIFQQMRREKIIML